MKPLIDDARKADLIKEREAIARTFEKVAPELMERPLVCPSDPAEAALCDSCQ